MSELFGNLQPLYNPIGFGVSDFILLAWAVLLVLLLAVGLRFQPQLREFAARTRWCMLAMGTLPVVLRLAMLGQAPVPTPHTPDDFAYLLLGDTLAHFRLANPPHPMHRFFETNFVLQEPAYSSIYPLGQGMALAFGQIVFHQPWVGVLLAAGLFSALCYWMLRGWTSPGWALLGGLLTVAVFGPLGYWMNTYWGGSVAAAGGCLIFGALPRLKLCARRRDAALLGLGFGIEWLTRPFESLLLAASVALYLVAQALLPAGWRRLQPAEQRRGQAKAPAPRARHIAGIALLAALPALGLSLLQNRQVTGSWTTLPYQLSQRQYGIPATFSFQAVPIPSRPLTQEQKVDYEMQSEVHGREPDSWAAVARRLGTRVRFLRFFFPVPLLLVLPLFLFCLSRLRNVWLSIVLAILGLGTNFYPYFYPHYVAGAACLFVLAGLIALERLHRWSEPMARLVLLLCGAQFLFWYGLHLAAGWGPALALTDHYESWDFVNHGDPEGRAAIERTLAETPGRQLVFVRYWPLHRLDQWVFNAADIDASRVVRALDLGPEEDRKLQQYYPGRTAWLLEPDADPVRLTRYQPPPEAPAPQPGAPPFPKGKSPFEEVPRQQRRSGGNCSPNSDTVHSAPPGKKSRGDSRLCRLDSRLDSQRRDVSEQSTGSSALSVGTSPARWRNRWGACPLAAPRGRAGREHRQAKQNATHRL
jgi:hypothetical protein